MTVLSSMVVWKLQVLSHGSQDLCFDLRGRHAIDGAGLFGAAIGKR